MKNFKTPNRRNVLAGQAGLLAVAGTIGTTQAANTPDTPRANVKWQDVLSHDLLPMIGQKFLALGKDGLVLDLTMKSVDTLNSGPARPKSLKRKEGLSALFHSPDADKLAKAGSQTMVLKHPQLGKIDVFLNAIPRPAGGYHIEMILN
ncbi:MAG: DUF6916 family protein [bacterium]